MGTRFRFGSGVIPLQLSETCLGDLPVVATSSGTTVDLAGSSDV